MGTACELSKPKVGLQPSGWGYKWTTSFLGHINIYIYIYIVVKPSGFRSENDYAGEALAVIVN
jgi:hypothetical protein